MVSSFGGDDDDEVLLLGRSCAQIPHRVLHRCSWDEQASVVVAGCATLLMLQTRKLISGIVVTCGIVVFKLSRSYVVLWARLVPRQRHSAASSSNTLQLQLTERDSSRNSHSSQTLETQVENPICPDQVVGA